MNNGRIGATTAPMISQTGGLEPGLDPFTLLGTKRGNDRDLAVADHAEIRAFVVGAVEDGLEGESGHDN
jgi:hypothetical protein